MEKNVIGTIAIILLFIGGINWGLVAFGVNLVTLLLGTGAIAQLVYILVALSAIYVAYLYFLGG